MCNAIGRILVVLLAAGLCLLAPAPGAHAGSVNDSMHIDATVGEILEATIKKEPSSLSITNGDLHKGYKKIQNGTFVSVTSNNPDGYILAVSSANSTVFTSVLVEVNGIYYELLPGGTVEIHMPHEGYTAEVKISYEFQLSASAVVGEYPWPIAVTVHPLP